MPNFVVTPEKTFKAYTIEAEDMMRKLDPGHVVDLDILWPRSTAFNGLVFGTISKVAKAREIDEDELRAELMLATGRWRFVRIGNKRVLVIKSMHKRSMTDSELHRFWDEARPILGEMLKDKQGEDADEARRMLEGV